MTSSDDKTAAIFRVDRTRPNSLTFQTKHTVLYLTD